MIGGVVAELPVIQPNGDPRERADAARNRRRILEAAAALVRERGIDGVSMQDVAEAACVGTGTLYRRFGDRAGLALALLDEQARTFQDALIAGPPPLGPGAPAADRLHAFGEEHLQLVRRHAELLLAAERNGRDGSGPLGMYVAHVAMLLRRAAPHADAQFTAEALLVTLSPGQYVRLHRGLGWSHERIVEGWHALVDAVTQA